MAKGQSRTDSLLQWHEKRIGRLEDSLQLLQVRFSRLDNDLALTGTRLIGKEDESNNEGTLTLGGYIASYAGHFSDTAGGGGFQKFPTVSPRSNEFGVDMALLSAQYRHRLVRANFRMHWGDIAKSAWSPDFNVIQEANAGLRLHPRWWLDMGFFRTHIGLESIQPRENICQSLSLVTYFEPYYMSGAKLSFTWSKKVTLQAQVLNSFNGFLENNKGKALGISALLEPDKHWTFTTNLLFSNDAPSGAKARPRWYWNTYATGKWEKLLIGLEANVATQRSPALGGDTLLFTSDKMVSFLASARYQLHSRFFAYGRADFFYDPDEILTGPVKDSNHELVGLEAVGGTLGLEWRPLANASLRCETREILALKDEKIFDRYGQSSNLRWEFLAGLGIWF